MSTYTTVTIYTLLRDKNVKSPRVTGLQIPFQQHPKKNKRVLETGCVKGLWRLYKMLHDHSTCHPSCCGHAAELENNTHKNKKQKSAQYIYFFLQKVMTPLQSLRIKQFKLNKNQPRCKISFNSNNKLYKLS